MKRQTAVRSAQAAKYIGACLTSCCNGCPAEEGSARLPNDGCRHCKKACVLLGPPAAMGSLCGKRKRRDPPLTYKKKAAHVSTFL